MGQAAGQAGQAAAGKGTDDAFRHFRDKNGTFHESAGGLANNDNYRMQTNSYQTQSCQTPNSNNYNNNNNYQMQNHGNNNNHMSSPGAMVTNAVSGMAGSCLYTDVTRPNGPMAREPPMEDSRPYGHQGKFESRNRDSFSTHNLNNQNNQNSQNNQAPPCSPPPPTKAEASTMMSTAFLQRNCPHMEPHKEEGGVVQFKIDTVNEECQVSERYNDGRDDYNSDRQANRRDDHRHDDRRHDDHRRDDRRHDDNRHDDRRHDDRRHDDRRDDDRRHDDRRHDERRSDDRRYDDRRHDDRRHDDHRHDDHDRRHDDRRHDDHQQRSRDTGMSTYDEVQQHGPQGMMTYDEPIQAPPLFQQSPQKPPPPPAQQAPGHAPGYGAGTESQYSGFTALTSVSQQQHCPSMAPSNVGSVATNVARSLNVGEELKIREAWAVGSVIEVFSSSAAKWYIAQVVQLGEKSTAHMLTVQFVGDNGQIMQKSMPRSDVQLAVFGRNTRQMPPNFQKVASESRPGQFSYQDSASGQKYQTKELAWQNYYQGILKSEQAQQLLRQQSLTAMPQAQPQPQPQPQPSVQAAAERLAAERLKPPALPATLQPAPTMSLAPTPLKQVQHHSAAQFCDYSSSEVPEAHTVAHVVSNDPAKRPTSTTPSTVSDLRSVPAAAPATPQKPQTTGDISSLPRSGAPFPGYGQSFAVGTNAGYEAYLASQGMA